MSTRGQREAKKAQAHVLEGRVRRWEKKWVQGSEKSKCDVYKWVVATDAETGAEVVSAPSARARTFVPTEPTPAQLKAHQAAMAPSAAVAGGGVAASPAAPAAKKRRR